MERFKHMLLATVMIAILVGICSFQESAAFEYTASVKKALAPLTAANE